MTHLHTAAALSLAAALAVGCVPTGGDRDGDPGMNLDPQPDAAVGNNNPGPWVGGDVNYPAGVSEGDQVAELDEGQRQAACDALEATYADAIDEDEAHAFACGLQALFAGAFDEMDPITGCEMAYDACLAGPPQQMEAEGDEVCPLLEYPDCTATLAEIEGCIQFGLQTLVAFNDAFECALLEQAGEMPGMEDEDTPCTVVETKCPGLLDDDADETSFAEPEPPPE